jgi:rhodanese-related sulfurtransferase
MPIMCTTGFLPIDISFKDHLAIANAIIIDCRTGAEYELGHLKNAINVPLQQLSIRIDDLPCTCDDAIFVYCRTGNRSETFATYIRSIGFTKCQSIAGGFELWGESEC